MKHKLLIVEDESVVAMEIKSFLQEQDFEIIGTASNADDAYSLTVTKQPSVILMDIHLEGDFDGIQTVELIQERYDIPIIYVTAFADEKTIERAVKTKPAAYLVKPFNRQELIAAIKIALFASAPTTPKDNDMILDAEFSYDLVNQQLICRGQFVHLTKRERQLLHLLIASKNQIITIDRIENDIWPDKAPNENTRRSLVNRLRAKLKHQFLETIPSIGYRIQF